VAGGKQAARTTRTLIRFIARGLTVIGCLSRFLNGARISTISRVVVVRTGQGIVVEKVRMIRRTSQARLARTATASIAVDPAGARMFLPIPGRDAP